MSEPRIQDLQQHEVQMESRDRAHVPVGSDGFRVGESGQLPEVSGSSMQLGGWEDVGRLEREPSGKSS